MKTFFTLKIMPPAKQLNFATVLFTGIPFFADSFGVFFANRDRPILFGFPFLLSYLIFLGRHDSDVSLARGRGR
jgi:hypothetical protein